MPERESAAAGSPTGLMQRSGLTVDRFIDYAADCHGNRAVVTRRANGLIDHSTYDEVRATAKRISNALLCYGIRSGDRIGTLASNTDAHLALWYAVMGIGATCHTINPRLFDEQLKYVINHANDRLIFADEAFAAILDRVLPSCPGVHGVILLDAVLETGGRPSLRAFIEEHGDTCAWGEFDETTAAGLCYTSGTTGVPKGVLYSHRSNYLHTLHTIAPDAFGLSALDVVMPVVPMYHANAWGLVFSAPAVGAKLVLPGSFLDGRSLFELIEAEGVTFSAAVPTVWQGLIEYLESADVGPTTLRRVVVGGSACTEGMACAFERLGVKVLHAWGMTELSPVGLVASPTPEIAALNPQQQREMALKQGRPVGIQARIVDDCGLRLRHDGRSAGHLLVRGPTVAERYVGQATSALTSDGWFDTGDIATIDAFGVVQITDRAKDIIKSGGEWISSVEIENHLVSHPAVALAAVIGVQHPKWGERPRLYVQPKRGRVVSVSEIRGFLEKRIARWWMPDEIIMIEAMPLGPTGKIDKKVLRCAANRAPSM